MPDSTRRIEASPVRAGDRSEKIDKGRQVAVHNVVVDCSKDLLAPVDVKKHFPLVHPLDWLHTRFLDRAVSDLKQLRDWYADLANPHPKGVWQSTMQTAIGPYAGPDPTVDELISDIFEVIGYLKQGRQPDSKFSSPAVIRDELNFLAMSFAEAAACLRDPARGWVTDQRWMSPHVHLATHRAWWHYVYSEARYKGDEASSKIKAVDPKGEIFKSIHARLHSYHDRAEKAKLEGTLLGQALLAAEVKARQMMAR